MSSPEEIADRERYVGRCLAVVLRLEDVVDRETVQEAHHLIDHGEPSIGIEYLAWAVTRQARRVPADLVAGLRDLVLDQDELPPDLDAFADA